jgi:uncharacterized membrane protein YozB (DUF420 family)
MNENIKPVRPILIIFVILNGLIIALKPRLDAWGFDRDVLLVANLLFCALTVFTMLRQIRAMKNSNPNAFVRSIMAGTMIKMFVCIIAVVAYILAFRKTFNKPAVYLSLGFYVIYLVAEVRQMMKLNKTKNG